MSDGYDQSQGHGILSDEEYQAWKALFSSILSGEGLNILEVGCGTGEISFLLAACGHTVSGIDLSDRMLEQACAKVASGNIHVDFSKGDAESPDFPDSTFDVVINRYLLWTLPHPEKAIAEWMRVIKPGGKILIIDGNWRSNSYLSRIKRGIVTLGYRVFRGRNAYDSLYSPDVEEHLPHPYGMSHQIVMDLCTEQGLHPVSYRSLKTLARIIYPGMTLFQRISAPFDMFGDFYIVIAEKPVQ